MKKNPCFCHSCYVTSPHVFGKTGLDITMKLHERGFGAGIGGVMVIIGATAPITLFGALVIQTVDSMASSALTWALDGGLRGVGRGKAVSLDMKEMSNCQGSPESFLMILATKQIAEFYGGRPVNCAGAFDTDSKFPDTQAGMEKAYKVMAGMLAGFVPLA